MARDQVKRKQGPAPVEIGRGILVRGGARIKNDTWRLLEADEHPPQDGDIIVPLERFKAEREVLLARRGRLGVLLKSDEPVEEIGPDAERFALVMVQFPVFRDGRGLTIARLLRERYRFKGEIRAAGDVLEDQIFFMLRCGFTSFEIIAADPEAAFARAARSFTHAYQASADGLAPAHVQRARRREARQQNEVVILPATTPAQRAAALSGDRKSVV